MTAPFTNQSVTVRIHLTNSAAPVAGAKIMALTQLGTVRQTAVMHAELGFGWGAAILSDAPGDSSTSVTKAAAVAGNVVCVGGGIGPLVVEGGVLANGRVNTSGVQVLAKAGVSNLRAGQAVRPTVSMGNLSTAAELPDYTVNGATDQLFDFNPSPRRGRRLRHALRQPRGFRDCRGGRRGARGRDRGGRGEERSDGVEHDESAGGDQCARDVAVQFQRGVHRRGQTRHHGPALHQRGQSQRRVAEQSGDIISGYPPVFANPRGGRPV